MSNINEVPCFLDFEASSLAIGSYPIQVAWALPGGAIESYFIDPRSVPEWTDWDEFAELEIHQIPRELLAKEGLSPFKVAEIMNTALLGKTVYCDGGGWDQMWLDELFCVCDMRPNFVLGDFNALVRSQAPEVFTQLSEFDREEILKGLEQRAFSDLALRQHRADNDVRAMRQVYEYVQKRNTSATRKPKRGLSP